MIGADVQAETQTKVLAGTVWAIVVVVIVALMDHSLMELVFWLATLTILSAAALLVGEMCKPRGGIPARAVVCCSIAAYVLCFLVALLITKVFAGQLLIQIEPAAIVALVTTCILILRGRHITIAWIPVLMSATAAISLCVAKTITPGRITEADWALALIAVACAGLALHRRPQKKMQASQRMHPTAEHERMGAAPKVHTPEVEKVRRTRRAERVRENQRASNTGRIKTRASKENSSAHERRNHAHKSATRSRAADRRAVRNGHPQGNPTGVAPVAPGTSAQASQVGSSQAGYPYGTTLQTASVQTQTSRHQQSSLQQNPSQGMSARVHGGAQRDVPFGSIAGRGASMQKTPVSRAGSDSANMQSSTHARRAAQGADNTSTPGTRVVSHMRKMSQSKQKPSPETTAELEARARHARL